MGQEHRDILEELLLRLSFISLTVEKLKTFIIIDKIVDDSFYGENSKHNNIIKLLWIVKVEN